MFRHCRCAALTRQALCAKQGPQVREGSWQAEELWLQGLGVLYHSGSGSWELLQLHCACTCEHIRHLSSWSLAEAVYLQYRGAQHAGVRGSVQQLSSNIVSARVLGTERKH